MQLTELFRTVFGFDRGSEHYAWKFRDNPDGEPVIALAEDKGKVVGQYALWPTRLRLGGKAYCGAQSLDTMTHPDYRGQGMFTVLAEECMKYAAARGIEALYGFPNENSYTGFVRRLDWDHTGDIPVWVRPLLPSKHHRVPAWAGPLADVAASLLPRGASGGVDLRDGMPTEAEVEALLDVWRDTKPLCAVERSAGRYAWRFSRASGMGYRWLCAYQGGKVTAAGVWGIDIRNGNALLTELIGTDQPSLQAVLGGIVRTAVAAGCPLMLAVSSRVQVMPALRRCGFVRRRGLPLIVRKLTARTLGANVHCHANWDVFGADLDTF